MDNNNNASKFLSSLHSIYYQNKKDKSLIDLGLGLGLGLSLTTSQAESYHSSSHMLGTASYNELMEWPESSKSHTKKTNIEFEYQKLDREEESEGVQSKERWAYIKVNMDGHMVGRKLSLFDHIGFSSLANQLEQMFGMHSESGLRLFDATSEFSLFYKDTYDNWRVVGDVPWKEFMESVKRLRIARQKNDYTFF